MRTLVTFAVCQYKDWRLYDTWWDAVRKRECVRLWNLFGGCGHVPASTRTVTNCTYPDPGHSGCTDDTTCISPDSNGINECF